MERSTRAHARSTPPPLPCPPLPPPHPYNCSAPGNAQWSGPPGRAAPLTAAAEAPGLAGSARTGAERVWEGGERG
eukprot:359930-Chlamydomonas_euryale.AAC.1